MSQLLVCIPSFPGDAWLVLKNLEWVAELDGKLNYECLLSMEKGMDFAAIQDKAGEIFTKVHVFQRLPRQNKTWPFPQNKCFQDSARHIETKFPGSHFFWWEADCIPLKSGWLDALEAEYQKGGKPFCGPVHPVNKNMNGVAIYPFNISHYSVKAMLSDSVVGYGDAGGCSHGIECA